MIDITISRNLVINILIHVFILFIFLYVFFFTFIAKNSGLSPLIVLINLGVVGFSVWFFVIYITPFKSLNQYRLAIIFSCSFLGDLNN